MSSSGEAEFDVNIRFFIAYSGYTTLYDISYVLCEVMKATTHYEQAEDLEPTAYVLTCADDDC